MVEDDPLLIEKVKASFPKVYWDRMSNTEKRDALFNRHCPAGGKSEEDYHEDGLRYWEKKKNEDS